MPELILFAQEGMVILHSGTKNILQEKLFPDKR